MIATIRKKSFLVINVSLDNWPILRDRMQANNMV